MKDGLTNNVQYGEAGSADTVEVEPYEMMLSDLIPKELLHTSELYNADKTGLFWRSLPRNSQVLAHEGRTFGRKISKDRVSALC